MSRRPRAKSRMIIAIMSKSRLSRALAPGLFTLLVWALVAASAVSWWLRMERPALLPAAPVAGASLPVIDTRAVARVLGAEPAAVTAAPAAVAGLPELQLSGVLTHGAGGAALIAVEARPPRVVQVGGNLPEPAQDWTLESVERHAVVLSMQGREQRLEMPPMEERSHEGDAQAVELPAAARPLGQPGLPTAPGRLPRRVPGR